MVEKKTTNDLNKKKEIRFLFVMMMLIHLEN